MKSANNTYPSCEEYGYYVFYFWTVNNNTPDVLRNVEGYPKWFKTKEEAIAYISNEVDNNVNLTWCIAKTNEWDIEKLKKLQ